MRQKEFFVSAFFTQFYILVSWLMCHNELKSMWSVWCVTRKVTETGVLIFLEV